MKWASSHFHTTDVNTVSNGGRALNPRSQRHLELKLSELVLPRCGDLPLQHQNDKEEGAVLLQQITPDQASVDML